MGKYVYTAVLAAVVFTVITLITYSYLAADAETAPVAAAASAATPVIVVPAERSEFVEKIEALGTAQANESVTITAQVTETVRQVNFEDGMRVKRDDILVELTDAEEDAQLDDARIALDEAEKQYRRVANLVKRGLTTQAELDEQRAERDRLKAQAEAIEARLADRLIQAPFDGVLGFRGVSPGALITPGSTITTLDDISVIKLDFPIPETFLGNLQVGQAVIARSSAYPERDFQGLVTSIASRVDPITRAVTVRAQLPNPEGLLKPGKLLTVELIKDRRQALMIPEEALVPLGSRQYVFVVQDDNTVSRQEIEIGRRRPGAVEVLSGLVEGQRVITEGTNRVSPGSTVTIQAPQTDVRS